MIVDNCWRGAITSLSVPLLVVLSSASSLGAGQATLAVLALAAQPTP
jgi:hypothetical protein